MEHVMTAMPWSNTVDVVTIPGSAVREMLEHSVSQYDADHPDPGGRFLQVSGIEVHYDTNAQIGNRVREVKVKVGQDLVPLVDSDTYEVAVLSFMVKGGDGYSMIPNNLIEHRNTGFLDNDLLVAYLKEQSPLGEPIAGRIFLDSSTSSAVSYFIHQNLFLLKFLALSFISVLLL